MQPSKAGKVTMKDSDHRPVLLSMLLTTLSLALFLRLYGISWGLPDVFEEATPLREAWKMWGWGPMSGFDPNPHFFNYPSLPIYCQLIGQGVLYIVLRLWKIVDSTIDFSALYVADPTAFLITGRLITALFGFGAVWGLYGLCRKIVSPLAAIAAAFFLSISTFHIEKSQVVEVDVPLTFFCILALLFVIRIIEAPSRRNYLLAGLWIGLACSTKYTAALLVIPLLVSHMLAGCSGGDSKGAGISRQGAKRRWTYLGAALGITLIAFLVTSPFVLLDASTFLQHISIERLHMREGHFGLERSGTVWFYLKAFSERMAGWPLLILSLAGFIWRTVRRRRPAELVLAAFAVIYGIAVTSWAMKADRYLLPILPIVLVFAAAAVDEVVRLPVLAKRGSRWRIIAASVLFLAAGVPLAISYPAHMERYTPNTRTLAREWIEAHVPSGAFIATESYGPELMSPHVLFSLDTDIRKAVLRRVADRPQYAVQPVPMLQVYPERTSVYYDLRLYLDADFFITSSAIRSRYDREPARFASHIAFYDSLDIRFHRLQEFSGPTGPTVTVYQNRGRRAPFAARGVIDGPRPIRSSELSGTEALFYSNLGMNYEAFKYFEEAITCYGAALRYGMARPSWYTEIVLGMTRSLMVLGRVDETVSFLTKVAERAPTPEIRARVIGLSRTIREDAGK